MTGFYPEQWGRRWDTSTDGIQALYDLMDTYLRDAKAHKAYTIGMVLFFILFYFY
jgi:hypothetical protein